VKDIATFSLIKKKIKWDESQNLWGIPIRWTFIPELAGVMFLDKDYHYKSHNDITGMGSEKGDEVKSLALQAKDLIFSSVERLEENQKLFNELVKKIQADLKRYPDVIRWRDEGSGVIEFTHNTDQAFFIVDEVYGKTIHQMEDPNAKKICLNNFPYEKEHSLKEAINQFNIFYDAGLNGGKEAHRQGVLEITKNNASKVTSYKPAELDLQERER